MQEAELIVTPDVSKKSLCQARLLRMVLLGAIDVAPQPFNGPRVEKEDVLRIDWLAQEGIRRVSPEGPVFAQMCNNRPE